MSTALPRPLDPFAGSRGGRYEDDAVVVVRRSSLSPQPGDRWTASTRSFRVTTERGRLVLLHALRPGSVDNDVALLLDEELFAPGWAGGSSTFERLLTGVVLSCDDDPLIAWEMFYRSTLDQLDNLNNLVEHPRADGGSSDHEPPPCPPSPEGALAGLAPVYRRAGELVDGGTNTLLDLGTCFGFFPLRMARARAALSVQAADLSPSTCDLVNRVSLRLGVPIPVFVCDAAYVPLASASIDTVTLLHVLEHVDAGHGAAILREAVRVARRRVIVAVPLESEPAATFGHVRNLDLMQLASSGADLAGVGPWRARVEEFHGGWLVLDRLPPV